MTIKPIETKFMGYRFRSRLEARWAVFFNALGLRFEYEKEGFDLDGIYYLPDFWLPDLGFWIEIKGEAPNEFEIEKARRLAMGTGKPVALYAGDAVDPEARGWSPETCQVVDAGGWCDSDHMWCECPHCGSVGITFEGRAARLPCGCIRKLDSGNDRAHNPATARLLKAHEAARSARFEHGERG